MSHPYNDDYENSQEDALKESEGEDLARRQDKKPKIKAKKGDMAKKMFKAHGSIMDTIMKGLKKKPDPFKKWKKIDSEESRKRSNLPPGRKDSDNE